MQKLKWQKRRGGKFHAEVTEYKSTTEDGYRAEFEVYRGCHRKVCEWMVWYPGSGQIYGVCYDLAEVKKVVAEAIEDHRGLTAEPETCPMHDFDLPCPSCELVRLTVGE